MVCKMYRLYKEEKMDESLKLQAMMIYRYGDNSLKYLALARFKDIKSFFVHYHRYKDYILKPKESNRVSKEIDRLISEVSYFPKQNEIEDIKDIESLYLDAIDKAYCAARGRFEKLHAQRLVATKKSFDDSNLSALKYQKESLQTLLDLLVGYGVVIYQGGTVLAIERFVDSEVNPFLRYYLYKVLCGHELEYIVSMMEVDIEYSLKEIEKSQGRHIGNEAKREMLIVSRAIELLYHKKTPLEIEESLSLYMMDEKLVKSAFR